jgi:hypothetical protein
MTHNIRKILRDLYLDQLNDYLTIEKYAEHNQILVSDAKTLLDLGRKYFSQGVDYPEFDETN